MKLHSQIDVITNSSSSVFICLERDSEKKIKNIMEKIMKGLGVEGSFEDFFEIKKGFSKDFVYSYGPRSGYFQTFLKSKNLSKSEFNSLSGQQANELMDEYLVFLNHVYETDTYFLFDMYEDGDYDKNHPPPHAFELVLTFKKDSKFDILRELFAAFNLEDFDY